uniref:Uncharacterized protein n=2 Tax=Eukaryota TaxID=2759 RepID=A0A0H5QL07_9EUKA|eukprot:CRZ02800.1 hypothetical protein [Spongospora subterranea]
MIAGGPLLSFSTHPFSPSVLSRRCDICSKEELNVVRCSTILWGLPYMWSTLTWWTKFYEGFPNHPCSWLGLLPVMIQTATWSKPKKRRLLLLFALASIGRLLKGDDASSCVGHSN